MDHPIFIGGAGRSGTTLLRVMLNAHPHLAGGPEFKVTPAIAELFNNTVADSGILRAYMVTPAEVAEHFRALFAGIFAKFLEERKARRLVEKTPHNVLAMRSLGLIFPDAKFIHVIRDGRDVAASLVRQNWTDNAGRRLSYVQNIHNAALYWMQVVNRGRHDARAGHLKDRVLEVRYELVVREPRKTMARILEFLDEPWDDAVLHHENYYRGIEPLESSMAQVAQPLYTKSVSQWEKALSRADKEDFKQTAGTLLIELGYAANDNW